MDAPDGYVKITYIGGRVEFPRAPLGYSRCVTYDEAGNVVSDETKHYVCIDMGETGRCMCCGCKMPTTVHG